MANIIKAAKDLYNDVKEASSYNMTKRRSSKWPEDWFTMVWETPVPMQKKLKVYNEYKNAPYQWEKDGVKYGSFTWTRADWVPVDFTVELQKKANLPEDAATDYQVWKATWQTWYWVTDEDVKRRTERENQKKQKAENAIKALTPRRWVPIKTVTMTKATPAVYKWNISL